MSPIFELLVQVIELYKFVLIAAVIMSWLIAFNVINTNNRFVYAVSDVLYRVTEPALRPIRRFIPSLGGVDISPIILILLLWFVQRMIVVNILYA
jgi:YggT family protein